MSAVTQRNLSPKEAVTKAFEHFKELYADRTLRHLLLEGVRYEEQTNQWEVTIGFDIGREKTAGGQLSFLDSKREPIREFRVVRLKADDGTFMELDHE